MPNQLSGRLMLGPGIGYHLGPITVGASYEFVHVESDFRSGFVDRRRWRKPTEGEAYVYTRLKSASPLASIYIGLPLSLKKDKSQENKVELGLRFTSSKLSFEQGYDRYNQMQPFRGLDAKMRDTSLCVKFTGYNDLASIFGSLEISLKNSLDFGVMGSGSGRVISFRFGYTR
ncbi:MAG: hypothetical protein US94_C0041G0008 [Berkelbacteria bacterium GW2011_GWB1_38_5]|uniref:Uncharacterized protein n=2 Tax=Candidatus Berkelbacteria TaxID=1618330 RepID=A0A0G0N6E4_9BACT|nr:MAG: hypothetical protein US94_C0041G0008 [Berkelbacteria bacterium GW2011_GWB1_38_5]